MQTVIIVVHLFIVLALIGVVLLQRSEGGLGLGGGGGGGGGFMTGRGQANALTRATAILAALFFVTSLALAWISSHGSAPRSILERNAPGAPASQPAPGGTGGNVLDQLRQMQGGGQSGAPAAAPEPATPQVPQSR
ncbi:MAG TPA: preprotein translocase subunit SecG [Beijerinckiaceae bacterium]|jgi:preprotein translocase subunit SecG|nr:preprotein translocase subunit SecG [Beijerinckiaceae bacterium]